jgi:uncharacterized protein
LIFSLEGWPEAGIECDFALSPGHLSEVIADKNSEGENPKLLTSMRGHLKLQLIGRRLKVKGFFAVKVELICHRCLSLFVHRIDDNFDDQVLLAELGHGSQKQGEDLDLNDEDELMVPTVGQSFNLAPLMAEFFWLAWPFKALCQPDCAGLCPNCGANLNEGSCYCKDSQPTKH